MLAGWTRQPLLRRRLLTWRCRRCLSAMWCHSWMGLLCIVSCDGMDMSVAILRCVRHGLSTSVRVKRKGGRLGRSGMALLEGCEGCVRTLCVSPLEHLGATLRGAKSSPQPTTRHHERVINYTTQVLQRPGPCPLSRPSRRTLSCPHPQTPQTPSKRQQQQQAFRSAGPRGCVERLHIHPVRCSRHNLSLLQPLLHSLRRRQVGAPAVTHATPRGVALHALIPGHPLTICLPCCRQSPLRCTPARCVAPRPPGRSRRPTPRTPVACLPTASTSGHHPQQPRRAPGAP